MRRVVTLSILVAMGILASFATNEARQARAPMMVLNVAHNLHVLASDPAGQGMRSGGNTAVFETADGVVLVDTKLAGYGPDILEKVQAITAKPVTTIINTHTHYDHTGANAEFSPTVDVVAHDNTAAQMSRPMCEPVTNCDAFKGANAEYRPNITYSTAHTLFSREDQIDLYYFGRGHTDGDTFVVFRAARAMHTGDMFARKALPFIDAANGNGSATEFGETLNKAIAGIENVDTIIPGHNDTTLAWSDLVDMAGFYNDLVDRAKDAQAAGQSSSDAASAYSVPARFSEFQAPPQTVASIMQLVYDGQ